jgi:hypothetical protein
MWVAMIVEGTKFLFDTLGFDFILELIVASDCDSEFREIGEDHK